MPAGPDAGGLWSYVRARRTSGTSAPGKATGRAIHKGGPIRWLWRQVAVRRSSEAAPGAEQQGQDAGKGGRAAAWRAGASLCRQRQRELQTPHTLPGRYLQPVRSLPCKLVGVPAPALNLHHQQVRSQQVPASPKQPQQPWGPLLFLGGCPASASPELPEPTAPARKTLPQMCSSVGAASGFGVQVWALSVLGT